MQMFFNDYSFPAVGYDWSPGKVRIITRHDHISQLRGKGRLHIDNGSSIPSLSMEVKSLRWVETRVREGTFTRETEYIYEGVLGHDG